MSAPRPGVHFTAPAGWINDPLGVTWHATPDGGRYELFFQFNPEAPVWSPACRWGQATGPDLVRWADPRIALEPGPHETGCWSGSVVTPAGGPPLIVYTSVLADDLHRGRVALATGDAAWRRWTPDPAGPVLAAPTGLDLAHVRDPFVWRAGSHWAMVLGAGRTGGVPAVLRYSSADLRDWAFDGVLTEAPPGGGPGGAVWECPQLFRLDGAWVLLVSVWDGGPAGVAGAVGDLDGGRFIPRGWQPVAPAPLYATTTFDDAAGRRCALSWLPDDGPAGGPWAGALSMPWLLGRDGDRITVAPHPDVATLRTRPVAAGPGGTVGPVAPFLDAEFVPDPAARRADLVLAEADRELARVVVDPSEVTLQVPGRPAVPVGARGPVRLLVDAGLVEVFAGAAARAGHVAANRGLVTLRLAGEGEADRHRLRVHALGRVFG